jgi:hypothetical protein
VAYLFDKQTPAAVAAARIRFRWRLKPVRSVDIGHAHPPRLEEVSSRGSSIDRTRQLAFDRQFVRGEDICGSVYPFMMNQNTRDQGRKYMTKTTGNDAVDGCWRRTVTMSRSTACDQTIDWRSTTVGASCPRQSVIEFQRRIRHCSGKILASGRHQF